MQRLQTKHMSTIGKWKTGEVRLSKWIQWKWKSGEVCLGNVIMGMH